MHTIHLIHFSGVLAHTAFTISSSSPHRGIPNREASFCLFHAIHRTGFGENAWIGQIFELFLIGAPPALVVHIDQDNTPPLCVQENPRTQT